MGGEGEREEGEGEPEVRRGAGEGQAAGREGDDEPREDWITELTRSGMRGEPLTEEQMVAAVVSLITGGHHSTSRALGSLISRVVTEPGLRDRLIATPADIPAAVDETVRLHTPLTSFSRRATSDIEVDGHTVAEGDDVLLLYAAANGDAETYDEPEAFRLDRDKRDSLAFGYGPHH